MIEGRKGEKRPFTTVARELTYFSTLFFGA
jgi:hypothetical protein